MSDDTETQTKDVPLDGVHDHGVDEAYADKEPAVPETQGPAEVEDRGRGSALKDVNETPSTPERSNERSFEDPEALVLVPEARDEIRAIEDDEQSGGYRRKAEAVAAWVNGKRLAHNLEPRYSLPQVPSYDQKVTTDQARPRHERKVGEGS